MSFIFRMTTPSRIKVVGLICFTVWSVVFVIHHALSDKLADEAGNAIGRDFLAFYAAGAIALDGAGDDVYDAALQERTQAQIIAPATQQGISYFINPASMAAAYSLFARLPYLSAFYLHTAMMLLFYLIGMWVLKSQLSTLSTSWLAIVLIGVSWMPMIADITVGQNAPLSFMLLSIAFVAMRRQNHWLAGVALGLQFFKPQHAVLLLMLLLLQRRFVAVGVACLVAGLQYLLGAWYCGWDWPLDMLAATGGYFKEMALIYQGDTHVALLEVINYSVNLRLMTAHAPQWLIFLIRLLSWCGVGALLAYLGWKWRKADPSRDDFGLYWALAVSGGLLASPHTSFHDVALIFLSMLLIVDYCCRTNLPIGSALRWALVCLYFGYPLILLSRVGAVIQFQPLFLIPVWTVCWAVFAIRHDQRGSDKILTGTIV